MISARDYALSELDAKRLPNWRPSLLRARGTRPAQQEPEDPRDRALAEQIIIGVTKNLLHLQWLISYYTQRPLKQIDPLAQKIVAIGLYQLRFLTRIPPSAAVDEAVKQAKRVGHARAAGFVNAVLRNAVRNPDIPLPDRNTDPAAYAENVLSHPRELFTRLASLLGEERALKLCEHDNLEPPTIVRLYPGATEADLQSAGITITPHEEPDLFIVSPTKPAILADWAQRGIAQVQDPTAAKVVRQLGIEPGQTVLDRCCGLGTKTLQMRSIVGGSGTIVAVDPSEFRVRTLQQLTGQRHLDNVMAYPVGMLSQLPKDQARTFDRILIDAPCSNSGVLARRPEARYAQDHKSIASVTKLQDRILDDTAPWLNPGGRLAYSTCSIWPEENEQRISAFLRRHKDYQLLDQHTTLPSFDADPTRYHDGGYYALLTRR